MVEIQLSTRAIAQLSEAERFMFVSDADAKAQLHEGEWTAKNSAMLSLITDVEMSLPAWSNAPEIPNPDKTYALVVADALGATIIHADPLPEYEPFDKDGNIIPPPIY
jgi:hypothetical protein